MKLSSKPKVQSNNDDEELKLSNHVYTRFKESMVSKAPETKLWKECLDAYYGELYKMQNIPDYKSDEITNYVFKTLETIRPIMVDNNPKFMALARNAEGVKKSDLIQKALDYEWDREKMKRKLPSNLLMTLITGNSIFFLPWDGNDDKQGNVKCIPVNPFNLYPDPLAQDIDSAEYIIYATYKNVNELKKLFPQKAEHLEGSAIKYSELVSNRDKNATKTTNQVLVLEMWTRDYSSEEMEQEINGKKVKVSKRKYPTGRVITCAPELNVVLSDKPNPYKDGKFPFVMIKDYDVPFKFWGKGDVEQILSPQKYLNDLNNQIIDNAKATANMQWIIDKNSGIGKGVLTNRPGLIVRKNPGTEVRRDAPPPMPSYVNEKIQELKGDIETISGVHETLSGERPTGIQAGNAIMALQEASQTRIRLKVKMMEDALGELATMWYSRMQQFWKLDRYVRVSREDGSYDFEQIKTGDLKNSYDLKVFAGSTMPKNKSAMLDLMIRLGQTMGEDGLPIVGRKEILEFVDLSDKQGLLKRMEERAGNMQAEQEAMAKNEQLAQQVQQMQQQIVSVVQELQGEVQNLSNEVAKIEQMEEKKKEQEKMEKVKEQGYNEGLKELPPDLKPDEKEMMGMIRGDNMQQNGDNSDDFTKQVLNGKIPNEVLSELEQLPPEELKAILEKYPQIEDMLNNN